MLFSSQVGQANQTSARIPCMHPLLICGDPVGSPGHSWMHYPASYRGRPTLEAGCEDAFTYFLGSYE